MRKCSKDSEFTEAKTTSDLETGVPKKGRGEEVRQEQRHQGDRCCSTGVLPPGLQPDAVWPPCQLADYLCAPQAVGDECLVQLPSVLIKGQSREENSL